MLCDFGGIQEQALTSTQGYSLPDFLSNYSYLTQNKLLPDRVEGSEEHPLCPIIDKSKEWKCNTFVMMDFFVIPRNKNFTLQQCQSPFISKSIIKFKKNLSQNLTNVDSCKASHPFKIQNFIMKKIDLDLCTKLPQQLHVVATMTRSSTLVGFKQAVVLSFLAGPINLRRFIATRPEGTRQPDF